MAVSPKTGDAELTDREIMAQGRHKSVKVLPKYVKRTTRQITTGAKKRRAARTKTTECPNEPQPLVRMERLTMPEVLDFIGAGEGNRTLVFSLEGCCSTIELHPRWR